VINYASCHFVSESGGLDGDEVSASRPGRFTPVKTAVGTHWTGSWVGRTADLQNLATARSELEELPCQYELHCSDCPLTISGDRTVRMSASRNLLHVLSASQVASYVMSFTTIRHVMEINCCLRTAQGPEKEVVPFLLRKLD
jgi:hypothetical protein